MQDIRITTKDGQVITLPGKALAGLSEEYKQILLDRVEKGRTSPVLYKNPGAYSQLDRVSDTIIAALPPPAPPLWPMEESVMTWRILRGFIVALGFIGLALYLHLKTTMKGNARLEMERNFPWLTQLLTTTGIIDDFSRIEKLLDRPSLYSRIFTKYADQPSSSSSSSLLFGSRNKSSSSSSSSIVSVPSTSTISLQRTKLLLSALLGTDTDLLSATATSSVSSKQKDIDNLINESLKSLQFTTKMSLTEKEFLQLFLQTTQSLTNSVIYLACDDLYGIVGATPRAIEELGELYDRVIQGRRLHEKFSPLALSELATEIGFTTDELTVSQFLIDCEAVAKHLVHTPEELLLLRNKKAKSSGNATVSTTSTENISSISSSSSLSTKYTKEQLYKTWLVPLRKHEFINFMTYCINGVTIEDERLSEYLRVFYLLHMSGIREQAGVRSV